jgi:hypothetical protein
MNSPCAGWPRTLWREKHVQQRKANRETLSGVESITRTLAASKRADDTQLRRLSLNRDAVAQGVGIDEHGRVQ